MSVNKSWNALGNEFVKCPVDNCGHIGTIITKTHCKLVHNMTRDEVRKRYGMPKRVTKVQESVSNGIATKREVIK
ncbi:hypothetical protein ACQKMV_05115 [Lysinibacillus sp. NPDC094403]|uniref:hypothetical protein n=1 Tax=Lysinibacillus sp. NPDC094403 TaxID=3390581 RepID=UPI003CFE9665